MNGIASYKIFIDTSSEIFVADPSKGHLRSLEVTSSFLLITCDPNEMETWYSSVTAFVSSRRIIDV